MTTMLCSSRVAACGAERWKATAEARRVPSCNSYKLPSRLVGRPIVSWRRPLFFSIHAVSSDFNDPEKEDFYPDSSYAYNSGGSGGSESEGDTFSQSPGPLGDKLDAASQLSESVPSAAVDQLDDDGGDGGNAGARGGGSGGSGDRGDADSGDFSKKPKKLSASQKLTLAYAVLVGVGGAIGYAKSKSVKSLITGAISTGVLYYVYTQLPTNPVFASSMGLGISVLLLGIMGARFKNSGKLFPAGVVSLVSLIMTGGYIHGIMRGSHA